MGPLCPLVDTRPCPTPIGDGWLLKAVSLGPWVHLIEELQVFDQEPVESLVLSRSKVVIGAHTLSPTFLSLLLGYTGWGDTLAFCLAIQGPGGTEHIGLGRGKFRAIRVLTDPTLHRPWITGSL